MSWWDELFGVSNDVAEAIPSGGGGVDFSLGDLGGADVVDWFAQNGDNFGENVDWGSFVHEGGGAAPTASLAGLQPMYTQGQGPAVTQGAGATQAAMPTVSAASAPGAGGGMGLHSDVNQGMSEYDQRAEYGRGRALSAPAPREAGLREQITTGMDKLSAWGKENPGLAKLGIQAAGSLMGGPGRASGMQDAAISRASTVNAKNDALADTANARSAQLWDQSMAEGPQAMAQRSHASAEAATGRRVAGIRGNTTLSPEARAMAEQKALVSGKAAAVTAFDSGWGTGAAQQRAGLSAASGLTKPYTNAAYDATLARDVGESDAAPRAGVTGMLEDVLGNPTQEVMAKRARDAGTLYTG